MEPTERGPEAPDDERADDWPRSVEDWSRIAAEESILWPLFVVIALVAITLGAGILLFALHGRNLAGIAALAILGFMSVDAIRQDVRARGFGWISRGIVGVWAGSALAALAAVSLGLLELK